MARRQVNIFINGRQVENTLKSIQTEKRKINRELRNMTIGSDAYNKKAKELKDINGLLDKHRQKIGRVNGTLGKITGGITKFAGVAGIAFGVGEIIQYGKRLFDLGAEMELLGKKAITVFGQALPAVNREAEANATAMGLTTSAYIDQAAAMGDLLIPMKFTREEAANISTQLVNLSGALSEWTGGQISATEVSNTLSKALLGEREQLKTLGISIQEADVKARLAEKGLTKLTGTALQQAKAMATLELVMEKSTDAQTAYTENAGTMVRRSAELNARFSQLQENLATALVPVFERLLTVAEFFTTGIERISRSLGKLGGSSGKASETVKDLRVEFNREIETLKRANLSQENRRKLIDDINKKYKTYLPNLIDEGDSIEDIAAAQRAANKALDDRITLLAAEELFKETRAKAIEATKEELRLEKEKTVALEKAAAAQRRLDAAGNSTRGPNATDVNAIQNLAAIEGAIERNKVLQEQLRVELQETKEFAESLGIDTSGSTESGSGSPGDRFGAGQGAADDVQKNLEKIAEAIRKFQEEQRLEGLSDEERELEEIRLRYQKQIDLATELERSGLAQATEQRLELEALRDQELESAQQARDAARRERLLQAEEEQLVEDLERRRLNEERRQELETEINEAIREAVLSDRELAIVQLEEYYDELLAQANLFGIDTLKLEISRRKEKERINQEYDAKEKQQEEARMKDRLAMAEKGYAALQGLVSTALNDVLNEQERATGAGKLLALINIGVNAAEALSKATAASAGVPFPGNLAAIASSVATVLGVIGQAQQALNATPSVPQRKAGSYFTVQGEEDGQTYRAKHIGRPRTGPLPDYPVLIDSITGSPVLGSERGAEYFVAHHDLQNPAVMRHVSAIEAITRQRVDGGFSTADRSAPEGLGSTNGGTVSDTAVLAQLSAVLSRLTVLLDLGLYVRWTDDDVLSNQERFNELDEASGGVLG